jgi:hypothetical protein
MSEALPVFEKEKISHASILFEDYYLFLEELDTFDGVPVLDDDHAFYVWVTEHLPEYQNIDGVSLLQLFEKNVIENGMTKERFLEYCLDHNFPTQYTDVSLAQTTPLFKRFSTYFDQLLIQKEQIYLTWAEEQGIDTTPQATMSFSCSEEENARFLVHTDFANRGLVVAYLGEDKES